MSPRIQADPYVGFAADLDAWVLSDEGFSPFFGDDVEDENEEEEDDES